MVTDRNVRSGLAVAMLAVLAVFTLGAREVSAAAQDKIIKVVVPCPTVNIVADQVPAGWQRKGTVLRNLYPFIESSSEGIRKGLQPDPKEPVSVTLKIQSPGVVFVHLNPTTNKPEKTDTITVTIPKYKASATFDLTLADQQPGADKPTWFAGQQPQISGVPTADSDTKVVQIPANVKAAQILSQLDIDGDGLPDSAPDSDGDGLPDNWEQGGYRSWLDKEEEAGAADRLVKFSAPTAIGPGTPPVFVLNRQAVTTPATSYDGDEDGLSDFVEVFGLKFIDRNGNGVLDAAEWEDRNGDGLPSIGEYPVRMADADRGLEHDFAGFMFTDPSNGNTDGDSTTDGNPLLDAEDPEPLINPRTFGVDRGSFSRIGKYDIKADLDNDGLGNGADFGNDAEDKNLVDQPTDLASLIRLFRKDLYQSDQYGGNTVIPESIIEDLIGADWDGNGLYRVTDVRNPLQYVPDVVGADAEANLKGWLGSRSDLYDKLFKVGQHNLYAAGLDAGAVLPDGSIAYGLNRKIGLGMQDLLLQTEASKPFFPDIRVWTILYAWRVPGFDIDGNGYVGAKLTDDDVHAIQAGSPWDGQIDAPDWGSMCGVGAGQALLLTVLGFAAMKWTVVPRMRRPHEQAR